MVSVPIATFIQGLVGWSSSRRRDRRVRTGDVAVHEFILDVVGKRVVEMGGLRWWSCDHLERTWVVHDLYWRKLLAEKWVRKVAAISAIYAMDGVSEIDRFSVFGNFYYFNNFTISISFSCWAFLIKLSGRWMGGLRNSVSQQYPSMSPKNAVCVSPRMKFWLF